MECGYNRQLKRNNMKRFLTFIWVLIEPVVLFLLGMVAFGWALSLCGLFLLFMPETPLWLKYVIGVFDFLCAIMLIYSWVHLAYENVYKQNSTF